MKKIYIYPYSSKEENLGLFNPYIDDLIDSFSKYYIIVNKGEKTGIGILDIFRYWSGIHYVMFNWIEKIPDLKYGKLQTVVLRLLIYLLKMKKVKIVWTMHNKLAHSGKNPELMLSIVRLMLRKSDYILTHSAEGIKYGESIIPGSSEKIHYLPHPVKDRRVKNQQEKQTDILIWGTISPYKGIDLFIKYLLDNKLSDKYKILIAGKSTDNDYLSRIRNMAGKNTIIKNEFISDKDLQQMIASSRTVLFTYSKSSILSSGVLMDSLGYGAKIFGPYVGAFADLSEINVIHSFKDFDDLVHKLDHELSEDSHTDNKTLEKFLKENSWNEFAKNIHNLFEKP